MNGFPGFQEALPVQDQDVGGAWSFTWHLLCWPAGLPVPPLCRVSQPAFPPALPLLPGRSLRTLVFLPWALLSPHSLIALLPCCGLVLSFVTYRITHKTTELQNISNCDKVGKSDRGPEFKTQAHWCSSLQVGSVRPWPSSLTLLSSNFFSSLFFFF